MDNFELKSFLGSSNSVRSGTRISRIIKSIVESLIAGLKKNQKKHLIGFFFFTFLCFKSVLKKKNVMEYNHTMHAFLTLLNNIEFEKRNSALFYISLNQAWLH